MEGDADLWCSACGLRAAELLRGSKVPFECGESLTATSTSGRWERVGEWHGRVVCEGNAFHNAGGRFCTHDLEEKQSLRELESGSERQEPRKGVDLRSYSAASKSCMDTLLRSTG